MHHEDTKTLRDHALISIVFCAASILFGTAASQAAEPDDTRGNRAATERVDELIEDFISEHEIPGLALALTHDGRTVLVCGYGFADVDKGEPVTGSSLFRIASLSKPITAVAILRLVEQGKTALDDKVLDVLDFEKEISTAGDAFDPRWRQITLRHLLQHCGGWDRSQSFDAMFQSVRFAKQQGIDAPAGTEAIIRAMLEQKLDFDPGERYAYCNFGYCLLGRVIEKLSGASYEAFVQREVLAPLRITSMKLGKTRREDRTANEVCYYDAAKGRSVFQQDLGAELPRPYGCWCLEAMDAHGGWLASAEDLATFAAAFDNPEHCPILSARSIALMHERPEGLAGHDEEGKEKAIYYSLGWLNRELPDGRVNHWHTGSLDGTETILIRRHDGWNMVGLLNTRTSPKTKQLSLALDGLMHRAVAAINKADDASAAGR
ncbi:MAG: serine hydrolase domain-containing protein [Aureliella sp.]